MTGNPISQWLETAGPFDWLTNLTAFLSLFLMLLVAYGFRRYTKAPFRDPIDFLGTGIWIIATTAVVRLLWWDLLPDFMGFHWRDLGVNGSNTNWIFNIGIALGAWFILKGFYLLVEAKAPGQYSLLTAVFYPRRFRLSFRTKLDEE